MSVAIFSPTPYINKWQMSLCNNSSDNKSYWIHRVDVKVSAQVTTVTYMHQSQPSLHSLRKHLTVHLELWPGSHLIWCNATFTTVHLVTRHWLSGLLWETGFGELSHPPCSPDQTWPCVTSTCFPIWKDTSMGSTSRMTMNSTQRVVIGARQNTLFEWHR